MSDSIKNNMVPGSQRLQVFNFEGAQVRTHIDANGEPWWVAKDVAFVLGYKDTEAMTRRLDDDEKQNLRIVGVVKYSTVINEPGLYGAIFGSNKDGAEKFKRWIRHDVLPSIRKTGSYSLPQREWLQQRNDTKLVRRQLTDTLAALVPYARKQGSQHPEKFYINYSRLVNATFLILDGPLPKPIRDTLSIAQLQVCGTVEHVLMETIEQAMAQGIYYKEIYKLAKAKLEDLARIIGRSKPALLEAA